MRSVTTVYRADGTPITVVTIENSKAPKSPMPTAADISFEKEKLVESKPVGFGPSIHKSEPDR